MTPEQYRKREAAVTLYKDMLTLKRMMSAYSADLKDYNRNKSSETKTVIRNLQDRLIRLRQTARAKEDGLQSPRSLSHREATRIRDKFTTFSEGRKLTIEVTVGKGTCSAHHQMSIKKGYTNVMLSVGHMWYRSVWQNLYADQVFMRPDLIVLHAIEYLTNVPNVRIYSAICYSIPDKKMVSGWIGQAKLGGRSTFRLERFAALTAAQQLTVKKVNEHIKGEN